MVVVNGRVWNRNALELSPGGIGTCDQGRHKRQRDLRPGPGPPHNRIQLRPVSRSRFVVLAVDASIQFNDIFNSPTSRYTVHIVQSFFLRAWASSLSVLLLMSFQSSNLATALVKTFLAYS